MGSAAKAGKYGATILLADRHEVCVNGLWGARRNVPLNQAIQHCQQIID